MGIQGLSSYFSSSRVDFFQPVSLSGCQLIIDGNNLRYVLYRSCPGTYHAFGGDYDKYARYVGHYFSTLTKCGVTPVVVMDGGYDPSEIKARTVEHRMKEQTKNAMACTPENQYKLQVYPLLGKKVFLEVVREQGIQIIQADFEADEVIARMAMSRGCPVLSNDSDFFVFNVEFVLLDSVDIDASAQQGSLVCQKFSRDKFLSYFGLSNTELLHLLASLLGNDYIPPSVFDQIFANIKLPKKNKILTERHRKIKGLLTWLGKEKSATTALDRLLGSFQDRERRNLKEKVLRSMLMYSGGESGLEDAKEASAVLAPLPQWFRDRFCGGFLPHWMMDISVRHKFILLTQVELRERESSHSASFPILQTILDILTFPPSPAGPSPTPPPPPVQLLTRVKSSQFGLCHTFTRHPQAVGDIQGMSIDERRGVIIAALGGSNRERNGHVSEDNVEEKSVVDEHVLKLVPIEFQLMFLVLHYWSHQEPVTKHHIFAILLCRLYLTHVDPRTDAARNDKKIQERLKSRLTGAECRPYLAAAAKYAAFFHTDQHLKTAGKHFDKHLAHSLAVFQSILMSAQALNSLLGDVFSLPSIASLYNGTFVYNLTTHLLKRPVKKVVGNADEQDKEENEEEEWVSSCGLPPPLLPEIGAIFSVLTAHMPQLRRTTAAISTEARRRRKKKSKKEKGDDVAPSAAATTPDHSDPENTYFDMDNRFAALSIS